jgi:cob(I)alamin adenosyltransferase
MASFFTREGDEGFSGLLGKGRIPKYDLRMEGLGAVDEANSTLGLGRALCAAPEIKSLLLQIQRDLYHLMAEAAATSENADKFHFIDAQRVAFLEERTETLGKMVVLPKEFIVPGDSLGGAALDLARTTVRRAERRIAELLLNDIVANADLLRYLNRLSSLLFVLELLENQTAGKINPTLAKTE